MTKTEQETLRNIVARLKEKNCGCATPLGREAAVREANEAGYEVVMRLYLDTWVIPSLEYLLPGELHDPKLALRLSK